MVDQRILNLIPPDLHSLATQSIFDFYFASFRNIQPFKICLDTYSKLWCFSMNVTDLAPLEIASMPSAPDPEKQSAHLRPLSQNSTN